MRRLLAILVVLGVGFPAPAQSRSFADLADVTAEFEPKAAAPGSVVTLKITVSPKPDTWTYPTQSPLPSQIGKNVIKLPTAGDVVFVTPVTDPSGFEEKVTDTGPERYYSNPTTWTIKAVVRPTATAGKKSIELTGSKVQVCDKDNCFYTKLPPIEFEVLALPVVPVPAAYAYVLGGEPAPPSAVAAPAAPPPAAAPPLKAEVSKRAPRPAAEYAAAMVELQGKIVGENAIPTTSLWGFLATAAIWGWVSLVTPCVFPMIPITVSLFLKQGNKSPRQVLKLAAVYCLTIILVIGLSAVALLNVFRELSVNPYMNLFLGGLLLVFALSLFGMFDITLPNFLLRYSESKRTGGGMLGTVFGALAFSIVSFTCVAPFLGGFAGMAASGQFSTPQLTAGGLVFATAFASPFFVLALFPSLIKKLPKSGGWLDTIKAVMGFLEVAAALKFFRTAELRLLPHTEYFTFDVCLVGMVITSVVCGLYLLNLFKLPHDEPTTTNIGVGRLMWAMTFLGFGLYLSPALVGHRPTGVVFAWIDAFLLPDKSTDAGTELPWSSDLPAAVEAARKATDGKRFVFIDFTGVTCQNCKLNERNVFPRPDVDALLRRYTLVQMYTDEIPITFYTTPPSDADRSAEAAANLKLQRDVFGGEQLPLYAILEPLPDGTVRKRAVYDEGKINYPEKFIAFLKQPLGQ